MKIILRDGKVNISPKMEAFHARNLPLSRKMAINLQSFGSEDWSAVAKSMQNRVLLYFFS